MCFLYNREEDKKSKTFNEINIEFNELSNEEIQDMVKIVSKQNDTRYIPNVKHKMEDIILITLFAVLAKCNEWTEIESFTKKKEKWLIKNLKSLNGIPSYNSKSYINIRPTISIWRYNQLFNSKNRFNYYKFISKRYFKYG